MELYEQLFTTVGPVLSSRNSSGGYLAEEPFDFSDYPSDRCSSVERTLHYYIAVFDDRLAVDFDSRIGEDPIEVESDFDGAVEDALALAERHVHGSVPFLVRSVVAGELDPLLSPIEISAAHRQEFSSPFSSM